MKISEFIGKGLYHQNLSVSKLAKKSGVNKRTIESYLYSGVTPSWDKILKIADVLGYEVKFERRERYMDQTAKRDAGKLQLSLVPRQIIKDVAEVRMYGNAKYKDPDNWRTVEKQRYVDAMLRHIIAYLDDPTGTDAESGIKHLKHAACNIAFILEMEAGDTNDA